MAVRRVSPSGARYFEQVLSETVPDLDLTSREWRLREGQASEVRGVDVVRPGVFRPDRRRIPLGVSLPAADLPLTWADPIVLDSLYSTQYFRVVRAYCRTRTVTTGALPSFRQSGGTYTSSTGNLTASASEFADYVYRTNDEVLMQEYNQGGTDRWFPAKVLAKVDSGNITIQPGLGNLTGTAAFNLAQGRTLYSYAVNHEEIAYGCGIFKSFELFDAEGPWPTEMEGSSIRLNENRRDFGSTDQSTRTRFARIEKVLTLFERNGKPYNVLLCQTNLVLRDWDKVEINYLQKGEVEGILVGNGRKTWVLRDGRYDLLLDLGSDDYKGSVWRAGRIASNRYLLVCDRFAPRIIRAGQRVLGSTEVSGEETLAGLVPPIKPDIEEYGGSLDDQQIKNPSWIGVQKLSSGFLDYASGDSDYRVFVRLANLPDQVFSDFVPVVEGSIGAADSLRITAWTDTLITVGSTGRAISVVTNINHSDKNEGSSPFGWTSPIHSRATHLEVWRSLAGGVGLYLETRIPIDPRYANESGYQGLHVDSTAALLSDDSRDDSGYPVRTSDVNALRLPVQIDTDLSNTMPPMCRDIVSLGGTTLCFGKASDDLTYPVLYARNFYMFNSWSYLQATEEGNTYDRLYNFGGDQLLGDGSTDGYLYKSGDQVVFTWGGCVELAGTPNSGSNRRVPVEVPYDVSQHVNSNTLEIKETDLAVGTIESGGGNLLHGVDFYIRRPYEITWPVVGDDEDAWLSRTDTFQPENFIPNVVQLSRTSDTFRRAVRAGNVVVVIMDQGVHVLYRSGVQILRETVADKGVGTPWPNSVVVYKSQVFWATTRGIRSLDVSDEPDVNGRRGRLSDPVGEYALGQWFSDALDAGDAVDAGVDTRNKTIRFRRKKSVYEYETMVLGMLTNKVSMLDDDTGDRYVEARRAGATQLSVPELYSIDFTTGNVFQVYNQESSHPYDGLTLSGNLGDLVVEQTSIRNVGKDIFSPAMVGEIIRFRKADGTETLRKVLTATGKKLTFDSLPGLQAYDSFMLGAVRFRVRFAPYQDPRQDVKTLHGLITRLRGLAGTNAMTVRLYTNYGTTAPAGSETVDVFDELGGGVEDRVQSIEAQGVALSVEIENLKPNVDFDLELLELRIRDESDPRYGV